MTNTQAKTRDNTGTSEDERKTEVELEWSSSSVICAMYEWSRGVGMEIMWK